MNASEVIMTHAELVKELSAAVAKALKSGLDKVIVEAAVSNLAWLLANADED